MHSQRATLAFCPVRWPQHLESKLFFYMG